MLCRILFWRGERYGVDFGHASLGAEYNFRISWENSACVRIVLTRFQDFIVEVWPGYTTFEQKKFLPIGTVYPSPLTPRTSTPYPQNC